MNTWAGNYAEKPLIPFMENDILPYGISDTVPGNGHHVEEFAGLPRPIAKHFRADGVGYDEVAARIADHKGLTTYDATDLVISTLREYASAKSEGTKRGKDEELESYYNHELDKLEAPKRKPRPKPVKHYARAGEPAPEAALASIRSLPLGTDKRAACYLMWQGGLRIAEALTLTWADLKIKPGYLYVRRGKGGKSRFVPISPLLETELLALLRTRKAQGMAAGDNIIKIGRSALQKWLGRTLDIGAHQLRHSCGFWLRHNGLAIDEVAAFLGHANSKTAEIYSHLQIEDVGKKLGWGE